MNIVLNIATVLFEIIILFMFYGHFMNWKRKDKIFVFVACAIEFMLSMLNSMVVKPPIETTLFTIAISYIGTFFFNEKHSKKIFCLFTFSALAIISELLTSSVMIWLQIGTPETLMIKDGIVRIAGTITSKIVFLLLLRLIMIFDLRNKSNVYHSYWMWLMSVPIMNIIMLISVCYFFDEINYKTSIPFTVITVCSMYINLIVFYLFEKILVVAELRNKNSILENQIVFQTEQNDTNRNDEQSLMAIQHDIKTHFQLLYDMLKQGFNDEAEQYITDLKIINEETAEWLNTGNLALDAVFNAKISYAKKRDIAVNIDVTVPNDLKIESVDIAVLFGNLLDNAIESCERTNIPNKRIIVCILYKKNRIICHMENSTNEECYDDKLILNSAKAEGLHGMGIDSINKVIEKYNGIIRRSIEDGMFINEMSLWNV